MEDAAGGTEDVVGQGVVVVVVVFREQLEETGAAGGVWVADAAAVDSCGRADHGGGGDGGEVGGAEGEVEGLAGEGEERGGGGVHA